MNISKLGTLVVLALSVAGCASSTETASSYPGEVLYRHHCASCHGTDGTGSGPAATALVSKPADLTQIRAKRGGTFPTLEIASIIDGRKQVAAHGSRAMPVWGEKYGAGQEPGPMKEEQVSGNLLTLVAYLESLQK